MEESPSETCVSCSVKAKCQDAQEYIESLIRGIESFDMPATMFGFSFNRNTLSTLGSLAGTLLASQALIVFPSVTGVFDVNGQEAGHNKTE